MLKNKPLKFLIILLVALFLNLAISLVFGYILAHNFNITSGASYKVDFSKLNVLILPFTIFLFAFIEELMFRLPLKKNKLHFYISCALILCWICFKFFDFWLVLIIAAIAVILYLKRAEVYNKWFGISSITMIIIYNLFFALVHLSNYPDSLFLFENLPGILVILTSHLVSGLIFTYIYLKSNIIYSALIHFLSNAAFIYLYLYM